jgi:hypothetical protein
MFAGLLRIFEAETSVVDRCVCMHLDNIWSRRPSLVMRGAAG